MLENKPIGDLGALKNPGCIEALQLMVQETFFKPAVLPTSYAITSCHPGRVAKVVHFPRYLTNYAIDGRWH